MKKFLSIILILSFNLTLSLSQNWELTNLNRVVWDFHFFNADNGLALTDGTSGDLGNHIYRTTNKGLTWIEIMDFGNNTYRSANMSFVNSNIGFAIFGHGTFDDLPVEDRVYKTSDGGNSWTQVATNPARQNWVDIFFTSENIGFEWDVYANLKTLRKTADGGQTWNSIYTVTSSGNITDVRRSATDANVIFISSKHIHNGTDKPFLVKYSINTSTGQELLNGTYDPDGLSSIDRISPVNNNGNDVIKLACYNGIGEFSNGTLSKLSNPPFTMDPRLKFSFSNYGFGLIGNITKLMATTNGGATWADEFNGITFLGPDYAIIGNVAYAGAPGYSGVLTRKLGMSMNTNFDWRNNGYSGSFLIDGTTYNTPDQNGYIRGGTCFLQTNNNRYIISGSDTSAQFYYWGGVANASMNYSGTSAYIIYNGAVNADYKTKLLSTNIDALQNANQVKVLKDTNGVNNLIYESMGGIFYTRTKPGGDFKTEEIVSGTSPGTSGGYATFNNSNPYISEIKYPTNYLPERNIIACWEQREGSNIKIYEGFRNQTGPYWHWVNTVIHTLYNVPDGFKCFPKLYMSHGAYELRTLTFLEPVPNSTNKKLVGKVYRQGSFTNPEFEIIPAQNIQEYAVASIPELGQVPVFNQYIAYRLNQSVCYKRIKIGWDGLTGTAHYSVVDNEYNVSYNDNSFWRASVDIAVKNMNNSSGSINMQPVITYQGQYDTRITRDNGMGAPDIINAIYYPIYVKERLANGTWSSSSIIYNSLNNVQFRPNIIGSKHNNSCIVSFGKTQGGITKQYQVVPRWNAAQPNQYVCYPNSVTALDAALLKGALVDNSSASQNLMQLSLDAQVYKLEKNSFTVTDITNIEDGNFEAVNGVVVNDDVRYSFNLGNIIVNSNSIGFSNDIDTTIDDSGEWNENMQSLPFLLSNNDTLIIGRNASYILEDPNGEVQEIEYWVNLINKTTNAKHRELAHDTLRAGDSLQIEYLEGFIIDQISGGSDSFYVRLEIDTIAGDFGIGGGIGGDDGGDGDNTGIKRKIFWENERPGSSISSNLPTKFELYQNYPNPFNPATTIKYDLPRDVNVSIKVYDLLGKQVDVLVNNETKTAGRYEVIWNALNYASGLYIFRIEAGDFVQTRKMVLLK